jgi:hypothetical protein
MKDRFTFGSPRSGMLLSVLALTAGLGDVALARQILCESAGLRWRRFAAAGATRAMSHDVLLFLAVFVACAVEGIEAVTIVLGIGMTRGWRSASSGVVAAPLALAAIVAVLGSALTALPIDVLRLVIGGLLLVFGLQWPREAILRASGFKALHDEDVIFAEQVAAARAAGARPQGSTATASSSASRACSWRVWRWRSSS